MRLELESLLMPLVELAEEVGDQIVAIYQENKPFIITHKTDDSPVTDIDLMAHEAIVKALKCLTPDLPVLSEEDTNIPFEERSRWQRYWLVDPVDGTKELIQRTGDFTVNIALIDQHEPVIGVIDAPIYQSCYFAAKGLGAQKRERGKQAEAIHTAACDQDHLRLALSRRHNPSVVQPWLEKLPSHEITLVGSSLKSCLVAEGRVDLYPRLGPTSEWDTAAAQCLVEEAGGRLMDVKGRRLRYNMRDSLINPSFLVVGDVDHHWLEYFEENI